MSYLPCSNPSCKSHGAPHPNCHCYGMAEGGSVQPFCASNNAHKPSCTLYAEGGRVGVPPSPLIDPEASCAAATASEGANMLFGSDKSPYYGAFGSGKVNPRLAALKQDPEGVHLTNFTKKVEKGDNHIRKGLNSLFDGSAHSFEDPSDKEVDSIKDYIGKGGVDKELEDYSQQPTQAFAEGGDVSQPKQEDPLSTVLPEHNIILNTVKNRVGGYLNSLKPQAPTKLPFDKASAQTVQHKSYTNAVKLAARPLSIIKSIKDGSITPEQLKHFNSMYPELHDHLAKEMTKEVTKAQLEGNTPPYRVRQGMSLFLGAPLDSSFTPAVIQAAQATFAQKQAQQQPMPDKNKKGTATLTKASEQYKTKDQASEASQKSNS